MKTLRNDSTNNSQTITSPLLPHSIFPTDLREWIDPSELVSYVVEAAQTFYWATKIGETVNPNSNGHWPVLLSGLTYCYATGTLATAEVARRMMSDPVVRVLCRNRPSDLRTLIMFRGHHSELVKLCFARVAQNAWRARADDAGLSPGVKVEFESWLRKCAI